MTDEYVLPASPLESRPSARARSTMHSSSSLDGKLFGILSSGRVTGQAQTRSRTLGRFSGPVLSLSRNAFSISTLACCEHATANAPISSSNPIFSSFGRVFPNESGIHCWCSVTSSKRPARKRASSGDAESPFRLRRGRPPRSPAQRVRLLPLNLRRTYQLSDCESTQL